MTTADLQQPLWQTITFVEVQQWSTVKDICQYSWFTADGEEATSVLPEQHEVHLEMLWQSHLPMNQEASYVSYYPKWDPDLVSAILRYTATTRNHLQNQY